MYYKKKKVSFWAIRSVPKPVKVKFYTRYGEPVSFRAIKRVPEIKKVSFYAKKRKKRYDY